MSKASRRRQRPGNQPTTNRPTGSPSGGQADRRRRDRRLDRAAAGGSTAAGAGAPARRPRPPARALRARRPATGHDPSDRHGRATELDRRPVGRRERQRTTYKPSFIERYRTAIVVVAALAGVALLSAFVFFRRRSRPTPARRSGRRRRPPRRPPARPPNLGYVQPDMGQQPRRRGDKVTYTYCAPASGSHVQPARARQARSPPASTARATASSRRAGSTTSSTAAWSSSTRRQRRRDARRPGEVQGLLRGLPAGRQNCGPVIARFDQMSTPFQAILWGRVLPLETFDEAKVTAF